MNGHGGKEYMESAVLGFFFHCYLFSLFLFFFRLARKFGIIGMICGQLGTFLWNVVLGFKGALWLCLV